MLSHISLHNFVLVEQLNLELQTGMSALTGETGAGKSIIIDALDLVLGGRGSGSVVRHGSDKADITAAFDCRRIPGALSWLADNELGNDNQEVILRRIINKDGRSKHFINGQLCLQNQVRELGEQLVNIHGQHEHHALFKLDAHRQLLDKYANHDDLVQQVENCYNKWHVLNQQLQALNQQQDQQARVDLLNYQVNELEELALSEGEFSELEKNHKQLAHVDQLREAIEFSLDQLNENPSNAILEGLGRIETQLRSVAQYAPTLANSIEMIANARIQLEEATHDIATQRDQLETDPEQLHHVEQRLETIHKLARKHHIEPEQLHEQLDRLSNELDKLQHADQHKAKLQTELNQLAATYTQLATKLSQSRQKAAKKLQKLVTDSMQTLGMKGGEFAIHLHPLEGIQAHGAEKIEFMVTANPGQPLQSFNKVASGGEMSRISLAIQMITAQKDDTPTLIFDEVDVGIGGGTAEIVGKLLNQLGSKAQVLCITHLPQVAAQAHQHLLVKKQSVNKQTTSSIILLDPEPRIEEIARMLGGVNITEQSRKHAAEMLAR